MRYLAILILYSTCLSVLKAQTIMQEQLNYYDDLGISAESWQEQNRTIDAATQMPPCNLNKVVFGWHPYWSNGLEVNYNWNLISDFCFFSYEFDPVTGSATNTHGFLTNQAVTDALNNGVDVSLCVTLFSNHATFLGNNTARQTLISDLISTLQTRGATGINIDFEGIPSSESAAFTSFMTDMAAQLHAAIPGSKVSTVLYAVDWNAVIDVTTLAPVLDLFTIMGYDYYWSGSTTAGPNDPLFHFGTTYNYTLSKSVSYYLNKGIPSSKLVLGLPYYGREYVVSSSGIPAPVLNPPNSSIRLYNTVRTNSSGYYTQSNHHFDSGSYSPYFEFNNGNQTQCFIDDTFSLGARLDFILQRGLAGMAIWALGYDDPYPDLWNVIASRLTDCYLQPCSDTLYDMGGPNKNYYDDEDWSYTIAPPGAQSIDIQFNYIDVESGWDSLWIYDGYDATAPLLGAYTGNVSPQMLSSTGPALTIRFKSDVSTTASGWDAVYYCNTAAPPIASFTSTDTICQGDSVFFTSLSTDADSLRWTFTNGSPLTDTSINPAVYYDSSGIYPVQLIAYGSGGIDTLQQSVPIEISVPPQANFTAVDTVLYLPSAVALFVNNSTNADTYYWNLDGGTSIDQNPWYTYSDTGQYTITLVAGNSICPSDTLVLTNYITVLPPLGTDGNLYSAMLIKVINPVTDKVAINIISDARQSLNWRLYNANGACIMREEKSVVSPGTNLVEIAVPYLAPGIYLLTCRSKRNFAALKLIKE